MAPWNSRHHFLIRRASRSPASRRAGNLSQQACRFPKQNISQNNTAARWRCSLPFSRTRPSGQAAVVVRTAVHSVVVLKRGQTSAHPRGSRHAWCRRPPRAFRHLNAYLCDLSDRGRERANEQYTRPTREVGAVHGVGVLLVRRLTRKVQPRARVRQEAAGVGRRHLLHKMIAACML